MGHKGGMISIGLGNLRWALMAVMLSAGLVWGQEGDLRPMYEGAAYYPRAVELADGTILGTFDHGIAGGKAIACVRSRDGGRTWGEYGRMAEDQGRVDVANAFPVQLADGTIVVAYRHHRLDKRDYRIEISASGDGGRRWEHRGTIATGQVGLWEPFLLVGKKGDLQAYYASEEGIYPDQRIEMKGSGDAGRTWGAAVTVARKAGSRDGMPSVVRLGDGSLMACFEASDVPPFRFVVRTVRSEDGGTTWGTERGLVYQPANAARQRWAAGAPYLAKMGDGRLLVSYQTDEDVVHRQGDVRADPGLGRYVYERHAKIGLVMSGDGRSWSRPMRLVGDEEVAANWGSLCVLRDGRVLALVTVGGRVWCKLADGIGIER